LEELRHSDRVSLTEELKFSLPLVSAEVKRLESVMRNECERLQTQIANIAANDKAIDNYQFEIGEFDSKIVCL
jgi:hypothetical protein